MYANVPIIIAPKVPFAALEFKIDLMVTYIIVITYFNMYIVAVCTVILRVLFFTDDKIEIFFCIFEIHLCLFYGLHPAKGKFEVINFHG